MPLFIYNAIDRNGRSHTGEIQASDRMGAFALLERQQLVPVSLKARGTNSRARRVFSFALFGKISTMDKILLTKHLAAIIRAGLSLGEAIDILWEDTKRPMLKRILFEAKTNLERGQPLSVVFETYPKHFPPVFVGLLRAGEKSGTLAETLNNVGDQLIHDNELVKKVRAAMIYPAILLGASILVVTLLLVFLLPRLTKVFLSAKVKLPLITRFFIALSGLLTAQPFLTFGVFVLLGGGIVFVLRSPRARETLVALLQRLPLLGEIIKKLALIRFANTLNNLLKSGIGAHEALDITAKTIGNKMYAAALGEIREDIWKGGSLAAALRARENLFPRLLASMINVGEKTGTLEKSLETISSIYGEEVDHALKNLVGLLEPMLLLVMGGVVGGVALSVLLPIYQLVGGVK